MDAMTEMERALGAEAVRLAEAAAAAVGRGGSAGDLTVDAACGSTARSAW